MGMENGGDGLALDVQLSNFPCAPFVPTPVPALARSTWMKPCSSWMSASRGRSELVDGSIFMHFQQYFHAASASICPWHPWLGILRLNSLRIDL